MSLEPSEPPPLISCSELVAFSTHSHVLGVAHPAALAPTGHFVPSVPSGRIDSKIELAYDLAGPEYFADLIAASQVPVTDDITWLQSYFYGDTGAGADIAVAEDVNTAFLTTLPGTNRAVLASAPATQYELRLAVDRLVFTHHPEATRADAAAAALQSAYATWRTRRQQRRSRALSARAVRLRQGVAATGAGTPEGMRKGTDPAKVCDVLIALNRTRAALLAELAGLDEAAEAVVKAAEDYNAVVPDETVPRLSLRVDRRNQAGAAAGLVGGWPAEAAAAARLLWTLWPTERPLTEFPDAFALCISKPGADATAAHAAVPIPASELASIDRADVVLDEYLVETHIHDALANLGLLEKAGHVRESIANLRLDGILPPEGAPAPALAGTLPAHMKLTINGERVGAAAAGLPTRRWEALGDAAATTAAAATEFVSAFSGDASFSLTFTNWPAVTPVVELVVGTGTTTCAIPWPRTSTSEAPEGEAVVIPFEARARTADGDSAGFVVLRAAWAGALPPMPRPPPAPAPDTPNNDYTVGSVFNLAADAASTGTTPLLPVQRLVGSAVALTPAHRFLSARNAGVLPADKPLPADRAAQLEALDNQQGSQLVAETPLQVWQAGPVGRECAGAWAALAAPATTQAGEAGGLVSGFSLVPGPSAPSAFVQAVSRALGPRRRLRPPVAEHGVWSVPKTTETLNVMITLHRAVCLPLRQPPPALPTPEVVGGRSGIVLATSPADTSYFAEVGLSGGSFELVRTPVVRAAVGAGGGGATWGQPLKVTIPLPDGAITHDTTRIGTYNQILEIRIFDLVDVHPSVDPRAPHHESTSAEPRLLATAALPVHALWAAGKWAGALPLTVPALAGYGRESVQPSAPHLAQTLSPLHAVLGSTAAAMAGAAGAAAGVARTRLPASVTVSAVFEPWVQAPVPPQGALTLGVDLESVTTLMPDVEPEVGRYVVKRAQKLVKPIVDGFGKTSDAQALAASALPPLFPLIPSATQVQQHRTLASALLVPPPATPAAAATVAGCLAYCSCLLPLRPPALTAPAPAPDPAAAARDQPALSPTDVLGGGAGTEFDVARTLCMLVSSLGRPALVLHGLNRVGDATAVVLAGGPSAILDPMSGKQFEVDDPFGPLTTVTCAISSDNVYLPSLPLAVSSVQHWPFKGAVTGWQPLIQPRWAAACTSLLRPVPPTSPAVSVLATAAAAAPPREPVSGDDLRRAVQVAVEAARSWLPTQWSHAASAAMARALPLVAAGQSDALAHELNAALPTYIHYAQAFSLPLFSADDVVSAVLATKIQSSAAEASLARACPLGAACHVEGLGGDVARVWVALGVFVPR